MQDRQLSIYPQFWSRLHLPARGQFALPEPYVPQEADRPYHMTRYKIVPSEPTDDMVEAGPYGYDSMGYGFGTRDVRSVYRATVRAAPNPLGGEGLIEVVAKAIARAEVCETDDSWYNSDLTGYGKDEYRSYARAAIAAIMGE